MPSATEAALYGSQLEAALVAGLRSIDRGQQITVTQYTRQVLPLDGYVFWINSGTTISVRGSLHYAIDKRQEEDQTVAINRVIFTAEAEVQEFNSIGPGLMWVGQLGDSSEEEAPQQDEPSGLTPSPVLFAFSSRDNFYRKADVWHYVGIAVQPALLSQLVNSSADLPSDPIVNNSLPIWLSLLTFTPIWLSPPNPGITLFPSYLVPDNEQPPYGVVHIEASRTEGLQAAPVSVVNQAAAIGTFAIGQTGVGEITHARLSVDRVRITLYGQTNDPALDFIDLVNSYTLANPDVMGVMNIPVVRDEKRTSPELSMIAMKKTIEFEVSYYQTRVKSIAVQLIASAAATFSVTPYNVVAATIIPETV